MNNPRVVSLLPSATEVLCAVGGESLLVGRSHECDYPDGLSELPALTSQRTHGENSAAIDAEVRAAIDSGGSLYDLDVDQLRELKPDVILTQDLCSVCSIALESVRAVADELDNDVNVIALNPASTFDVFDDLLRVGTACGLAERAEAAMVKLRAKYWEAIDYVNPYATKHEVLFLEWTDPLFVGGHWTPALIEAAGGQHSLNLAGAPSCVVSVQDILEVLPERVVICPCGFDLEQAERACDELESTDWWKLLPAVQEGQVAIVDGSHWFNRPGPRLVDAFCWLVSWLQDRPEVLPADPPVRWRS